MEFKDLLLLTILISITGLLNAQNVGIGEVTPNSKFEIKGDSGNDLFNVKDQNDDSKLYILNNGNVGIGTTNPAEKLHISGSSSTTGYPTIRLENTAGHTWDFWPIDGNDLRIRDVTDGADRLTIEGGTGDVGIGTAAPSFRLDVSGDARFTGQVTVPLSPSNDEHAASKKYVDDLVGAVTESDPTWSGSANTTASVGRTGNVGVGTTSPSSKFHVSATDGKAIFEDGANGQAYIELDFSNAGSPQIGMSDKNNDNFWAVGADDADNTLKFAGRTSGSIPTINSNTSADVKMTIQPGGNVGIGTTSPSYKLDVSGAIAYNLSGFDQYSVSVSNSNFQELTFGGASLSQNKVYRVTLATTGTGTNSGYVGVAWYNSDATAWNVRHVSRSGTSSNHPYLIVDANTVKVRTDHSNNYSIAVSVQAYASDDDDDPNIFGADYMWQRVGSELNFPDGNVGIGVSNPSYKLDVSGTGRFTGQVTIPVTPSANTDAASKKYVDDQIAGTGDNLGNHSATTTLQLNNNTITEVNQINFNSGETIQDGTDLRLTSNSGYIGFRPSDGEHGLIIRDFDGSGTAWSGIRTQDNGRMELRADGGSYSQLVLEDGGNVGVGVSDPEAILHVQETDMKAIFEDGGSNSAYIEMDLSNAGSPQLNMSDNGGDMFWSIGGDDADNSFKIAGSTSAFSTINNNTSGDLKFTIETGGDVGIGIENPTYKLHVNGRIRSNGINETSDRRFKKNIQPLENALLTIGKLEGVSYEWKQDEYPNYKFKDGEDLGVIAQEVEKILPEVVSTDEEGYKSVQYSHLVPVLIEAIKEQQDIIDQQQNTICSHDDKIAGQGYEIQQLKDKLSEMDALKAEIEMIKENLQMQSKK